VRCITTENAGDLAARNVGLRATRAERVAFCDSDDLWRPGFLAAMAALWRAEPGIGAAYCDFLTVRGDAWGEESKFAAAPAGFWDGLRPVGPDMGVFDTPVVERLLAFQPLFPSCMAAERAFLLSVGGWDEGVGRTLGSDFATALRIAEHPLGIVRRPLVGIRKHAGNFSRDGQAMNLGDAFVLEHVLATRPSLAPLAPAIRASIRRRRQDALDNRVRAPRFRRRAADRGKAGAAAGPDAGQAAGRKPAGAAARPGCVGAAEAARSAGHRPSLTPPGQPLRCDVFPHAWRLFHR